MTHEHAAAHARRPLAPPSTTDRISSRMLERYLLDIEKLARFDEAAALGAAASLPAIATALEDENTQTSYARCREWCEQWLDRDHAAAADERALHDALSQESARAATETTEVVPLEALRQLRLRRHARPVPVVARPIVSTTDLCTALVHGVRRWYDDQGGQSAHVQLNLARLAVLR